MFYKKIFLWSNLYRNWGNSTLLLRSSERKVEGARYFVTSIVPLLSIFPFAVSICSLCVGEWGNSRFHYFIVFFYMWNIRTIHLMRKRRKQLNLHSSYVRFWISSSPLNFLSIYWLRSLHSIHFIVFHSWYTSQQKQHSCSYLMRLKRTQYGLCKVTLKVNIW